MKAIGFKTSHPIDHADSLIQFDTAVPELREHDLLVRVSAVSVNPVDTKVRVRSAQNTTLETPIVPGFDAVGIVEATGPGAEGFKPGDRVWYAGDVTRAGSNAEYQAVDARIAALAPQSLSDAEAAAMPLTALTGWEALFDRLRINPAEKKTLLIIGGAGGVGSITTQIASQLTNLTVIATASRPQTDAWVRKMGADHVANHRDLVASVKALGFEHVDYIFNTADTKGHWDAMVELIAPQGLISSIVESDEPVDLTALQGKSAGFIWELMFTRSMFGTQDIARQQDILSQLATLVDEGRIGTTLGDTLVGFSVETLKEAHRRSESGKTIGKIAITF
ncbi:zinc-binding alcohol dehydrogenase family protein [Marinobacterium rhizophilum]|uniref:Zinc-type alcohol dehydrogenase-like protein n=1 Tax=Marinobacterium rhizophilum TaxID=420402 RepID=A0ABY5HLC1_9GAMM|nr:zinc-binding alcohol dehydrogenase family protein [Marinobacterium rhizophilum]UTW13105.1 zinc-binding alcohol dehydrogenase family protein [Marinobacterium rhizophilum]